MATPKLSQQRHVKEPRKSATTQQAFERMARALETVLVCGNQTEIDFALRVAEMFAALKLDPETGHYFIEEMED